MSKKIECKTKFFIEMFKTTCVVKKETLLTEKIGQSSVKELQTITEVKTFQDVDEVWRFIDSHIPKVS